MGELLSAFTGWTWVILGMILCVLEVLIPGVYLVWFGVGGIITGLVLFGVPGLIWEWQFITFAASSFVSVILGRGLSRNGATRGSDRPLLNQRGQRLVGQVHVLDEPIAKGRGKLKIGDGYWIIAGPDLPAGTQIRIARVEGAILIVEPS